MASKIITPFVEKGQHFASTTSSLWSHVKMGPPDIILGITEAFKCCKDPKKVHLGVGAYRDNHGRPYVFPSVIQAERNIAEKKLDKEYLPIGGHPLFCKKSAELALGEDCERLCNESVATVQGISGTGSLKIGLEFFKHHAPVKLIHISRPTWGNHKALAKYADLQVKEYKYYNSITNGLNFCGLLYDIKNMPKHSIILFHACAHNPTGVDITQSQWCEISQRVKRQELIPFFDMAYQGFASGNFEKDSFALRQFIRDGHDIAVAQSYAKNMGLYGERIGSFSMVVKEKKEAQRIMSQLKILIRGMYSSPPISGQRIVTEILTNPKLKKQWQSELQCMVDRIIGMRCQLKQKLIKLGSCKNWEHVTNQIGMFCYTGLAPTQVERLTKDFHIYLTKDGRISISGLTSRNIHYVAKAIHEVSK